MRHLWFASIVVLLLSPRLVATVSAAETLIPAEVASQEQGTHWYRAEAIGIEGKGWSDTKSPFDRLPEKAEQLVRGPVWSLSRQSAGLCVRFTTDASQLRVRWTLTSNRLAMSHMPATGVSGVDLYVRSGSSWRWLAVGRPEQQSNETTLVANLDKEKRQYLLYLPLYNGVQSLEIGIPAGAQLWSSRLGGGQAKPLVFWGTSITQGGCASRPGMVHTAIVGRHLNRPVINLGFSGNGKMEPEVAKLLAELDPAVFVIDCLPNLNAEQVAERTEPVVRTLRAARPETPILLVEDRTYSDAFLRDNRRHRNVTNRAALRAVFERLKQAGVGDIFYLEGETLLGQDGEDTVDGSHPTDLGFARQADAFLTALRPILAQK